MRRIVFILALAALAAAMLIPGTATPSVLSPDCTAGTYHNYANKTTAYSTTSLGGTATLNVTWGSTGGSIVHYISIIDASGDYVKVVFWRDHADAGGGGVMHRAVQTWNGTTFNQYNATDDTDFTSTGTVEYNAGSAVWKGNIAGGSAGSIVLSGNLTREVRLVTVTDDSPACHSPNVQLNSMTGGPSGWTLTDSGMYDTYSDLSSYVRFRLIP